MIFLLAQTPAPIVPSAPATPVPFFLVPTVEQLSSWLGNLGVLLIVAFFVNASISIVLRPLLRRLDKEIALITLNVSQKPLLIVLLLFGLKTSFQIWPSTVILTWVERGLTALMVVVGSYWIAQIFTQVIAYYLKKVAQQSEAMWDDVLVPLLENTVPLIVYLLGTLLFLQSFGIDLSGLWVAIGGVTFVLGFALQDILSNFFSGLVLLIDTPFQFGDIIKLEDGTIAMIQKVGIRMTNLFIIDTHCELFVPNGVLQGQNIVNLTRPASHYYYSISIPLRGDTVPARAMKIIREVVLAHPDTLGNIDEKLEVLNAYYNFTDEPEFREHQSAKTELAFQRLLAEKDVNDHLIKIQKSLLALVDKIQFIEKDGLDADEARNIQVYYLELAKITGLEVARERQGKQRVSGLKEPAVLENTLIGSVRTWYQAWANDPNLTEEDPYYLQEEWERKIGLLKLRMNNLFQKIATLNIDERKLDDYLIKLVEWLNQNFKTTQYLGQDPKIWANSFAGGGDSVITNVEYTVKFFVDNIKLEQCQRGNRVKSEVQGELMRQLRKIYLYR